MLGNAHDAAKKKGKQRNAFCAAATAAVNSHGRRHELCRGHFGCANSVNSGEMKTKKWVVIFVMLCPGQLFTIYIIH